MASARELIDTSRLSRLQIRVLILCTIASMAEGYDIISMSLAALPITDDWKISGTQSGLLFSAGLIGMAIGSIGLGRVGDRFGRRPLLIGSLVVMTIGITLSALTGDVTQLALTRLVTGIGMGGIIPSLPVLVGEFSPARRRSTMIALFAIGVPLGGVIGGAGAAVLMADFGWPAAFLLGAGITAVAAVLAYVGIPESPDFLESQGTEAANARVSQLLRKMNLSPLPAANVPESVHAVRSSSGSAHLRSWALAATCLAFLLVNSAYFFSNSWTPKLLKLAGMSNIAGISGGLLFSLGGAAGTLIFAALTLRFASMWITSVFILASAILFGVLALVATQISPALIATGLLGLCLTAAFTGLYIMVPILFRPEDRVSALGIAAGIGRLGSIVTPLGIGALVDHSWTTNSLFLVFVLPTLLAAVAIAYAQVRNAKESATSFDQVGASVSPA